MHCDVFAIKLVYPKIKVWIICCILIFRYSSKAHVNLYAVLGVKSDASSVEIKDAFIRLSKQVDF